MKDDLLIDFLYVDLSECERCQSSDETLDEALRDLREEIHGTGISTITINKTKITSDEQAEEYGLVRSPTLRFNGKDIEEIINEDYEVKDSYCPSCEEVTGSECYEITGGGNECRVFEYEGKNYETIPKKMIKDAIRDMIGIDTKTSSSCCEPEKESKNCCEKRHTCC
ncbi:MAG: DUF2703 domain-containing protein [Candidatus Saliniplasma sp.]